MIYDDYVMYIRNSLCYPQLHWLRFDISHVPMSYTKQ